MTALLRSFLPALVKKIKFNGGILDEEEAARSFSQQLVDLAIKEKIVEKKTIVLNAKLTTRRRIPCIAVDWDNTKPKWLDRYTQN